VWERWEAKACDGNLQPKRGRGREGDGRGKGEKRGVLSMVDGANIRWGQGMLDED
jgi:hypothetical protein